MHVRLSVPPDHEWALDRVTNSLGSNISLVERIHQQTRSTATVRRAILRHVFRRVLKSGVLLLLLQPAAPAMATLRVPFLPQPPEVDGVPDAGVEDLPSLSLSPVRNASLHGRRPPRVRLAYGSGFLYAFVDVDADRLTGRDRAYQNGDGVLLVVTRAQADGAPSEEFSVLGFSAGEPAARWQQRFTWYRNRALEMKRLEGSRQATASRPGGSSFEIVVPWSEVYPLHPWHADRLGLNICVTQALPGDATARSCLLDDGRVDSENSPRLSLPATFDSPSAARLPQVAGVLDRNHVNAGGSVRLRLTVASGEPARLAVTTRVLSGEGSRLASRRVEIDAKAGLGTYDVEVPASALRPGGYAVEWEAAAEQGRTGLSVLRDGANDDELLGRLARAESRLARGSATTLRFRIDEIGRERRRLRPTDVATALRLALDDVVEALEAAERGIDVVATRTGVQRRAYRSLVDQELQPYSVRAPQGYRPGASHPLLVYLHGSGEDDRDQLSRPWLPEGFVLLAPGGRGPSTWYWSDHAQDDIREATDDVTANYGVDPARVVLAGFSMGGYGVYLTARESPRRFRALAVFSGTPRPRDSAAGGAPDFLLESDLSAFAQAADLRVSWRQRPQLPHRGHSRARGSAAPRRRRRHIRRRGGQGP